MVFPKELVYNFIMLGGRPVMDIILFLSEVHKQIETDAYLRAQMRMSQPPEDE